MTDIKNNIIMEPNRDCMKIGNSREKKTASSKAKQSNRMRNVS